MKKLIVAAIMAVVLNATPSLAGSDQPGPENPDSNYIGVFYPRIDFRGDTGNTFRGMGVRFGSSKANVLGGELSVFKVSQDIGSGTKTEFTGITYDLKLNLPLSPLAPYGLVGLGRYVLENPQTVYRGNTDGSGINGYQVGFGLNVNLSIFTLNGGYTRRRMQFDAGTPGDIEMRMQARSFDIGLAVHF